MRAVLPIAIVMLCCLLPVASADDPPAPRTVRVCNGPGSPVWVDVECYAEWADHHCFFDLELPGCKYCSYEASGVPGSLACVPIVELAESRAGLGG